MNTPKNIRRKHPRRDMDQCVTMINGKLYPVYNWSMGGALIGADERLFSVDEMLNMTLKFKLKDKVTDVNQAARVLRKSGGKIALQFAPLSRKTRNDFQHVVNDYSTAAFVDSHSA